MCMIDDGDGHVTMLSEADPKARKPHKCSECRRDIAPGEQYHVDRFMWEGDLHTHKTCAHCMKARAYLQQHCGGWLFNCVAEDIAGHYYSTECNDASEREPRLLALGMAAKWRRPDGRLWPIPGVRTTP